MKIAIIAGILMLTALLDGCASGPNAPNATQNAQVNYIQACNAWGSALTAAAKLRLDGELSAQAVQQITTLDATITPVCVGPLPADPTAATAQITAAVTELGIIEGVKAATGQTVQGAVK